MDRSRWPGLLFDTHCHLHFPQFAGDLPDTVEEAFREGVRGILVPSVDPASAFRASEIAGKLGLWSGAGFHPNHLEEASDCSFENVADLSLLPQAAAVGESGLDFYRDRFPREVQRRWFARHRELARDLGLPLVVHSRGAEEEVLEELRDDPGVPVILHSWNGSPDTTRKAVDRGFFLGVTGAATYRKSTLAEVFPGIPRDRVLLETDAPFLPPEPFRGQRNRPALCTVTAGWIAGAWGLSRAETAGILWDNALRALRLSPENRRTHLVYPLGENLYVNLTGKCNATCVFCVRFLQDGVGGFHLRHREEPSREAVLAALRAARPERFRETVFCGYGEPTLRPDLLAEAAETVVSRGGTTRLNTNGLCLETLGPEAAEALLGRFQRVSVSLNASSAQEYARLCPNRCTDGWESLMAFIRRVKKRGMPAVLTAVEGSGADLARVKALAARMELPFRTRGGS